MRQRSTRPFTSYRAFSLVEITAVVVIMGILAGIAVPRFVSYVANRRVEAAAYRLAVDLRRARNLARHTSTTQSVVFDLASQNYSLGGVLDPDRVGRAYTVEMDEAPYEVQLVSVDFGGTGQVIFDPFGVPDNGGEVVIGVGNNKKSIKIEASTGLVSISDYVPKKSMEPMVVTT